MAIVEGSDKFPFTTGGSNSFLQLNNSENAKELIAMVLIVVFILERFRGDESGDSVGGVIQ